MPDHVIKLFFLQVKVMVRDLGEPEARESESSSEVTVTVARNTFAPNFVDDVSTVRLSETAEVGSQVAVVEAQDGDEQVREQWFKLSCL